MVKIKKKHTVILFITILFILLIVISSNIKQNKNTSSINGTYQNISNSFNTLTFDQEAKIYYYYDKDEKSNGFFEKRQEDYYITTGNLAGKKVEIKKDELKIIDENEIVIYKKISNIPTIQNQ